KIKGAREKSDTPLEQLRREEALVFEHLRQQYGEMKSAWGGNTDYDQWFSREMSNAQLNSVAAYYDLVPGFEHLLELNRGDLEKFYDAADRLSNKPKEQRQQWLRTLGS